MPIRIYTLAKDLGIENKQLVDICAKLGIHGKGSALASLTDEEVEKVKQHLTPAASSAPAPPASSGSSIGPAVRTAPVRGAAPGPKGQIPTLPSSSSGSASAAPAVVEAPVETPVEVVAPTPAAAPVAPVEPPVAPTPVAPVAVAPVAPPTPAPVPEAPVAPAATPGQLPLTRRRPAPNMGAAASGDKGGATGGDRESNRDAQTPTPPTRPARNDMFRNRTGPLRDLTSRTRQGGPGTGPTQPEDRPAPGARRDQPRRDTVVRVAAMPDVKQPVAQPKQPTEKVQKPDIALPQDAIRKAKSGGGMAPLQQFAESSKAKQEKRKDKGSDGKDRPRAAPDVPVVETEAQAQARLRAKKKSGPLVKDLDTEAGMGNARDARTAKRVKRRPEDVGTPGDDEPTMSAAEYRRRRARRGATPSSSAPRKEAAVLQLPCTIREFSEAAGVPAGQVLKSLMELGKLVNINAMLEEEMAHFLVEQMGLKLEIRQPMSLEDKLLQEFDADTDEGTVESRPPIVTFLGHVDHGKTSLLDRIIGINVVSGEAGGITQHIRAYAVEKDGRKISFVDTPGHEAFTEMRARGANVTDIAVLVVAADDGIMPQTEEAISHARAAGVPIVVALNKCDLPGVNFDRAYQGLAAHELLPSEWGGDVEVVKTSALTGEGMDTLLETLLTTAELYELTARVDGPATGVCLEAEQESDRGVMAKIVVQKGTLKVGDVVVCGGSYGRVKAMYDTLTGTRMDEAGPSMPCNLSGLDIAPAAGDRFYVVDDIAKARQIAETRSTRSRERSLSGITTKVSLEEFQQRLESGSLGRSEEKVTLNLIIRADTRGSIEAIQKELSKLSHPEIEIRILQASVGGVSVADVALAQASQAVIIAFNVVPDDVARSLADERQVEIRRYDIIYKVADDIKLTLEGKLKPTETTVDRGAAMVLRTFTISRIGTIAGCRVMRGTIERDCRIRVIRENRIIGDYAIDTLRREKDDVKEVRQGMECGIKLQNFNDIKEADTLEAYRIEHVARTLSS